MMAARSAAAQLLDQKCCTTTSAGAAVESTVAPELLSTLSIRARPGGSSTHSVTFASGRRSLSAVDQGNDRYSCSFLAQYAATTRPAFTGLHLDGGTLEDTVST